MKKTIMKYALLFLNAIFCRGKSQRTLNQYVRKSAWWNVVPKGTSQINWQGLIIIMLFAGVSQGSTSWAAQSLKQMGTPMPSADTWFREVEQYSEQQMTHLINNVLQVDSRKRILGHKFRRNGKRYLVIDFHIDPSYAKKRKGKSVKGKPKNSTIWGWSYLTAELVQGTYRQTVALVLRHAGETIAEHIRRLWAELPHDLHIYAVLFDGEFASTDSLRFFLEKNVHFLGRCPARGELSQIKKKGADSSTAKMERYWIQAAKTNRNDEDAMFDVTWQWVCGESRLLIKDQSWNLTIADAEMIYQTRFSIETDFRDKHLFQPRTSSGSSSVRLLLASVGCWWVNGMGRALAVAPDVETRQSLWAEQYRTLRLGVTYQVTAMAIATAT
jgi:hypothetical protein